MGSGGVGEIICISHESGLEVVFLLPFFLIGSLGFGKGEGSVDFYFPRPLTYSLFCFRRGGG